MANETELALSAFWAAVCSQLNVSLQRICLPLDRVSPSLTQREASRAGSGSWSTMHQEIQDLEELVYFSFI